ncbi:hypothetical protein [Desulfopila sp. IMCC35006]|uniref:hypothetical protein n=1 Tax=Desulfopila sp. IMCC35006 TaxID=2569542 RepID=UPI00197A8663|nr:hypothetical protein [Desulfopila sp. IMCC35006]
MFTKAFLLTAALCTTALFMPIAASADKAMDTDALKGKYLIEITGCNDCHTSGYAQSGGLVPEAKWLLGDELGFRGPWGTTYPNNLRTYVSEISEGDWVDLARTLKARPPMPWWALNAMTDGDLLALYKYIKSLALVASTVPAYVPPGGVPKTPYIQWPVPPK